MAKEKKDPPGVSTNLLASFLEQAAGESAEEAGERLATSRAAQGILEWFNGLAGQQGTIQMINLSVAGLQTYLRSTGLNPLYITPAVAIIDDFFDGIKEGVRATGGKVTKDVVEKAYENAVVKNRNFQSAFRHLETQEQRERLSVLINAFCANETRAKQWKIWREKINTVQTLHDLLNHPQGVAGWPAYLTGMLGEADLPKRSAAGRFLANIIPTPTEGRARSNAIAAKIDEHTEGRQHVLRSLRNPKKYG